MKRQANNHTDSSNKRIGTLESLWSKQKKVDEPSNSTCTTLDTSISIIIESQTISDSSSGKQDQIVANYNASSCDISISVDHPPIRPVLSSYPVNNENRSFQSQWYYNRPWLEYSIKNDSAHCYYCRHFGISIQTKRLQSDAFTTGFNGWKRALETDRGFDQHVKSSFHIVATKNYDEYKKRLQSNASIINLLDKSRAELIKENRAKLMKICSTVLLCARQMIALRGHEENGESKNRGNLIELLHWASSTDPLVNKILNDSDSNATYLSPTIQNEILKILADQIRRKISNEVTVSIDYASAKVLIKSIINQVQCMRNEATFEHLLNDVIDFGKKHNINLNQPTRFRRKTLIPSRFKDSVVFTTTIGQNDWGNQESFHSNEDKLRHELFYSLIDSILIELNDRFNDENILLFSSVSAVHPSNQQFLEIESLKPLASHLMVDLKQLENELSVVKHFIREKKASMKTIQDLLTELKPVNEAFPATISLLRDALCLPVSSTTCERSFSRMKLIKTYCRNSMGDERLSDLTLLAVKRDFDIDLEETVDIFSKAHKNGRILLS
ncbi:unnamed protein product [Rotaria sp. Silwood2]|nr:unnamed protein product [Rotaria sp. Silwood2]